MSKKKLVIAVDFNGTCVTYCYPEGTGEDIGAVPVLKRLLAEGHQLVLMTGIEREGEFELPIVKDRWDDMLKWVEDNGLTCWRTNTCVGLASGIRWTKPVSWQLTNGQG